MIKTIRDMRFLIYVTIFFGVFAILTSCSNKQYQTLFEKKYSLADSSTKNDAITLDHYHIQSQDLLQIRNLQNISYIVDQPTTTNGGISSGSTSGQGQIYQVEEDGTVALPVIGRVQVANLTRSEAQKKVESLYKDSLLVNPIIDLKIVNLKVTILGEVKAQGNYPLLKDKTTLIELIGEAGGLTDRANETNIKIIRDSAKSPKIIIADLNDINSINNPDNTLQSGDIIYIAQNKRAVRNDNLQNFSTILSPILILLNTALIIFTLAHK
jgi:polysaccharide export outer membrane protein